MFPNDIMVKTKHDLTVFKFIYLFSNTLNSLLTVSKQRSSSKAILSIAAYLAHQCQLKKLQIILIK